MAVADVALSSWKMKTLVIFIGPTLFAARWIGAQVFVVTTKIDKRLFLNVSF